MQHTWVKRQTELVSAATDANVESEKIQDLSAQYTVQTQRRLRLESTWLVVVVSSIDHVSVFFVTVAASTSSRVWGEGDHGFAGSSVLIPLFLSRVTFLRTRTYI